MKTILFLDIDGVLNSERSNLAFGGYPHDFGPVEFARFDPVALALLRRLVDTTGCVIVLSTSWRITFTLEQVEHGLGIPVIGATPDLGADFSRADEIAHWLAVHPQVERFAIVDDLSMDWPDHPHIAARFVQTNPMLGLGLSEYRQLRHLLTEAPPA